MSIVVNPYSEPERWMGLFSALLPDETLYRWPETGDPDEVDLVIAWVMPRAAMSSFPKLRAVLSLGAGTEQWQREGMPAVDIVRLSDPGMSDEMAAFAVHWVVHFQRQFELVRPLQDAGRWQTLDCDAAADHPVGILGYGSIGARIGRAFADLGFPVNAWTRSGGDDPGVTHYAGLDELDAFLASSPSVVNVLPSTESTSGLLTARRFAVMGPDAVFVNIGRGTVVDDETDMIGALDSGALKAVVLDVTDPEPPVDGSPLFSHAGVHLTGHSAGTTRPETAARLIADNVRRIRVGEAPYPLLDRARGY